MDLKKRIAMGLTTIGLVSSLVGGATFAYFNATVANEGNTFTAGTIQIGQSVDLSLKNNIKPGDTGLDTIILTNLDSTLDSDVTMGVVINGNAALAGAVQITGASYAGADILDSLDINDDGIVTFAELNGASIDLGTFAADAADKNLAIEWEFVDTGIAQNDLQALNFTPVLNFEARQPASAGETPQ